MKNRFKDWSQSSLVPVIRYFQLILFQRDSIRFFTDRIRQITTCTKLVLKAAYSVTMNIFRKILFSF